MVINYRTLDRANHEIRLLSISSRGQDARFRLLPSCRIFHATLKERPHYVALSYSWGQMGSRRLILVEDSPVCVTINLYEAILALRRSDHDLIIWVDFLCINQEDNKEKNWQVGLIKGIYQQASEVLAWLGPADDNSDHVMTFLNTFGRRAEACGIEHVEGYHLSVWQDLMWQDPGCIKRSPPFGWIRTTDHRIKPISRETLIDLFHSISGWYQEDSLFPVAGMQRLFTRSWWGRIWVLQEIALPERAYFVCGTRRISRHRCRAAMNAYNALWTILRDPQSRASLFKPYHLAITTSLFHVRPNIMLYAQDIYRQDRFPLAALLRATCVGSINLNRHGPHHLESTDPRDKVFALLSLASDKEELEQQGIVPDYSKTCVDVYTATMAALLEQGRMSLLSVCQSPKMQHNLPSWVVDWSRPATDMLQQVRNDHVTIYPTFAASGLTESGPNVVVERKDEVVKGVALACAFYDEITVTGCFPDRISTHEVPPAETYWWPRKWLLEIIHMTYRSEQRISFRDRLAAAARTSIADVGLDKGGIWARVGDSRSLDAVTLLKSSLTLIKQRRIKRDANKFLIGLANERASTGRTMGDVHLSSEINGKS
ncbi:hypothetical protein LTR70_001662 [Exophiala xenobiotica]|nr:hypothetical protein LTR70_001662 [Exophiala xenobiotica]